MPIDIYSNNYQKYVRKNIFEEYLNQIKPYLKDVTIDFQKSETWKIKLRIAINFIYSKDTKEEQRMRSKSDNMEVMVYDNPDETF